MSTRPLPKRAAGSRASNAARSGKPRRSRRLASVPTTPVRATTSRNNGLRRPISEREHPPLSKDRQALIVDQLTPAELPLWRESLLGIDWVRLKASGVYYGFGVPRGDGAAVVLVPGFLATDIYLVELYAWLYRMNYSPCFSRIGRNADCPAILMRHLLETVDKAYRKTGRKVHLIGHSFGGVLARSLAAFHPDKIASVISLGSPLRGVRVHPLVLFMSDLVHHKIHLSKFTRPKHLRPHSNDCYTAECSCGFACNWRSGFPSTVAQTAIYTKSDGIVDWRMCVTDKADVDVEVSGTHCGLAWNPEVFRIIADRLHAVKKANRPETTRKRATRSTANSKRKAS